VADCSLAAVHCFDLVELRSLFHVSFNTAAGERKKGAAPCGAAPP
jgi:hypothetical protein